MVFIIFRRNDEKYTNTFIEPQRKPTSAFASFVIEHTKIMEPVTTTEQNDDLLSQFINLSEKIINAAAMQISYQNIDGAETAEKEIAKVLDLTQPELKDLVKPDLDEIYETFDFSKFWGFSKDNFETFRKWHPKKGLRKFVITTILLDMLCLLIEGQENSTKKIAVSVANRQTEYAISAEFDLEKRAYVLEPRIPGFRGIKRQIVFIGNKIRLARYYDGTISRLIAGAWILWHFSALGMLVAASLAKGVHAAELTFNIFGTSMIAISLLFHIFLGVCACFSKYYERDIEFYTRQKGALIAIYGLLQKFSKTKSRYAKYFDFGKPEGQITDFDVEN